MPSLTISRAAEPAPDWRAFAEANGTFYHRPEWVRCLADIYRLRLDCYSARRDGELQGLLAIAESPRCWDHEGWSACPSVMRQDRSRLMLPRRQP